MIHNQDKEYKDKEFFEKDGFIYYIKKEDPFGLARYLRDKNVDLVSIVDYRGPDRPILVLPEKLGDNYVNYYYGAGTMQTPRNVKYLVMEQPTKINSNSFPNSDIEGIIAIRAYDEDYPEQMDDWKEYTKDFIRDRSCKIFNTFTLNFDASHFEVDRKTLIDFFRKLSERGTRDDMKYILDKDMTLGDIYMEAIVGDNVKTIKRLESYGFPVYKVFKDSKDDFIRGIINEVRHFKAKNIEQYFSECEI